MMWIWLILVVSVTFVPLPQNPSSPPVEPTKIESTPAIIAIDDVAIKNLGRKTDVNTPTNTTHHKPSEPRP